jgi:short-subunit dehydrogenase
VTGGARGFGRAIAARLVARGHHVVVTDVDEAAVTATAAELGATGVAADARSAADHRTVAEVAAGQGRVAVWVNNAGLARAAKAWEHPDEDVEAMIGTNLLGMIHGSRVAVEAMRAGGGHLLNIASMSGLGPVPGLAVYAATKAGILNFTTSLQGDLDRAGLPVRAHALCPHAAATALVGGARSSPDSAILFSQRRLLTADEVADAAVAMLDGRRIVRSLPVRWAALSRLGALTPTVGLRGLAVLRGLGERERRRG